MMISNFFVQCFWGLVVANVILKRLGDMAKAHSRALFADLKDFIRPEHCIFCVCQTYRMKLIETYLPTWKTSSSSIILCIFALLSIGRVGCGQASGSRPTCTPATKAGNSWPYICAFVHWVHSPSLAIDLSYWPACTKPYNSFPWRAETEVRVSN